MKRILLASLLISSLASYNLFAKSEMYSNRGFELIRESNFNQIQELGKESGSLQTFETYVERNKEVNSKGILLGTVSNFVAAPNIHAGLTVAYQKYKLKEIDKRDREYSLNTYLSYKKDLYLITAELGYTQSKDVRKRAYSSGLELGKFSKEFSFSMFDRSRFYYYTGVNLNKWKVKGSENTKFYNYRLGLTNYSYLDKFRFVANLEVNSDSKKYDKNREKYNLSFSYAVSYNIYDDLLVELKYKGTKNTKFYNNLISLGFTHIF